MNSQIELKTEVKSETKNTDSVALSLSMSLSLSDGGEEKRKEKDKVVPPPPLPVQSVSASSISPYSAMGHAILPLSRTLWQHPEATRDAFFKFCARLAWMAKEKSASDAHELGLMDQLRSSGALTREQVGNLLALAESTLGDHTDASTVFENDRLCNRLMEFQQRENKQLALVKQEADQQLEDYKLKALRFVESAEALRVAQTQKLKQVEAEKEALQQELTKKTNLLAQIQSMLEGTLPRAASVTMTDGAPTSTTTPSLETKRIGAAAAPPPVTAKRACKRMKQERPVNQQDHDEDDDEDARLVILQPVRRVTAYNRRRGRCESLYIEDHLDQIYNPLDIWRYYQRMRVDAWGRRMADDICTSCYITI